MKFILSSEPLSKPDSMVGPRAWLLELRVGFQPLKNDFKSSPPSTWDGFPDYLRVVIPTRGITLTWDCNQLLNL